MKKIDIFPFNSFLLPYIRHYNELQNEYIIENVYVHDKNPMVDKDLSYSCNGKHVGINAKSISDIYKSSSDILVVINDNKYIEQDYMYKIFKKAIENDIKVLFYINKNDGIDDRIWELRKKINGKLDIVYPKYLPNRLLSDKISLQTPVILVGGLIDEPDITELLLRLYIKFTEMNINTAVITKSLFNLNMNFYNINEIFEQNNTENDKIKTIKDFVKRIEIDEQPDLILIEAPDPFIEYNEWIGNGYGIKTYMLSKAVSPDSIVGVMPLELSTAKFVETVHNYLSRKYDAPLNGTHISNTIIDSLDAYESGKITYTHAEINLVNEYIEMEKSQSTIPINNVFDDGIQTITEAIVNQLRE